LGIKPVLHVDDNGALINVSKVRGRKAALNAIADVCEKTILTDCDNPVFISHGDCLEDVKELENILFARLGVKFSLITDVGPVVGAHSGPGTIALFYQGKTR
jgi:fatty acid-binding protein DegV